MNKTLTTLVAAATLAGSLAVSATSASAGGNGFLPGLIVGGVAGAIVGGAIASHPAPGYVVYPGYAAPLNAPTCYWRILFCARSWMRITSSRIGWPPSRTNRSTRKLFSPSALRWASSGSCSAGSPAPSRGRWNCLRPRCGWPGTVSWWTRSSIRTSLRGGATSPTRSPRPSGASTPSRSWPGGWSCPAVTLLPHAATRFRVGVCRLQVSTHPAPGIGPANKPTRRVGRFARPPGPDGSSDVVDASR